MIFGAYCVGKVQVVFDNGSILCRKVHNMLPQ